jgi:hypothetical protein
VDLDDVSLWPPLGLRVTGLGLELAWARDDLIFALAREAAVGVHESAAMPFLVPWTRGTPEQVGRSVLQYGWGRRAVLSPGEWCLQLAVLRDGETGSWLGLRYQRQGIGWQMRLLVLHLLFDGLGAATATTSAFDDNPGSLGVTRKLGYRENGVTTVVRQGSGVVSRGFRMDRADWYARPGWMRPDVVLEGVEPVRSLLGVA